MKQKQIEKGPKTGEQDPEADGEQEGSIHWCALGHTLKVRYLGMRSFLMARQRTVTWKSSISPGRSGLPRTQLCQEE